MARLSQILSSKVEVPLKNPKQHATSGIQDDPKEGVGLQTLIHSEPKQHGPTPSVVHCYSNISTVWRREGPSPPPPLPLPPPSSSSMFGSCVIGDLIGTESGDYMSSNVEELKGGMEEAEAAQSQCNRRYRRRSGKMREFPQPISMLQGQRGNNMAWVFKRETSTEGRLIIRAEKVKRDEYLEARRENGRLRLLMKLPPLLVPMEDDNGEAELGDHGVDFNEQQVTDDASGSGSEQELGSEACLLQKKSVMKEKEEGERNRLGFWKGKGLEGPNGCLGRPGSAPLPPMATKSGSQLLPLLVIV